MSERQTERTEYRVQRPDGSVCDAYVVSLFLGVAVVQVGELVFPIAAAVLPQLTEPGATLRISSSIVKFPTPADRARLAAEEQQRQAEEEERLRLEAEQQRQAEEEARLRLEAEQQRQAEEEERLRAEAEARRQAEEEERLRVEAEARRQANDEARTRAKGSKSK